MIWISQLGCVLGYVRVGSLRVLGCEWLLVLPLNDPICCFFGVNVSLILFTAVSLVVSNELILICYKDWR